MIRWMDAYRDGKGTKEAQIQVKKFGSPLTVEFMRQLHVLLIRSTIYSNIDAQDKPYRVTANLVVPQNL